MAKSIGEVLRTRRVRLGLSQTDVAKIVGVAPNQISRVESGGRPNLYFETVARIAFALEIPLDDLSAQCGFRPPTQSKNAPGPALAIATHNLETLRRQAQDLECGLGSELARVTGQLGTPKKR